MTIAQSLLPEFDREMTVTRTLLQRVPEAEGEWKPHQKSFSLGDLATHVSNLPTWIAHIAAADFFDAAVSFKRPPKFTTTATLLEFFDGNVKAARQALASISDEQMMKSWSLKRGEQTMFTRPRADVLRSFVMNHMIHHRGQLSVYLRLQNVPLPNMYGPTADER
ncbi:MAG TPA: DinB family protein [Thermoanaerobaculia bacterium]|nr:DinB family protein [Thermoanaerobaculia bacterium]